MFDWTRSAGDEPEDTEFSAGPGDSKDVYQTGELPCTSLSSFPATCTLFSLQMTEQQPVGQDRAVSKLFGLLVLCFLAEKTAYNFIFKKK